VTDATHTRPFAPLAAALADRYRIERELGTGGMATVYLAHDLKHDRKVALKVLKPELAAVLGAERFVVEIKTTAALQHPHILPLFDSGTAEGFLYYVMPFIDGEPSRAKLDPETQLAIAQSVKITTAVADALDYAHRHGVIHRDIKPENILLHEGRPMVTDFGIALAVSAAAGGRMTETGLSLGTPHYMSPEQATAAKEISARSDVFSLASVLYEMLTGQPPHLGASAQQIIMKIITEQPAPVTQFRKSVPPNIAAALSKALEKIPADRFASAKAFADALTNPEFRTEAESARGGGTRSGARVFSLRAFAGVAALAIVAVAAAIGGWLRSPPLPAPARFVVTLSASPQGLRNWRDMALSPDGLTIAFPESGMIWLKTREQAAPEPRAGTEGGQGLSFSPDGEWIAFVADGRLRKFRRAGGEVLTIAEGAMPTSVATAGPSTAWLDDGTVLFSGSQGELKVVGENGGTVRVVIPRDSLPNRVFDIASVPGSRTALLVTCASNCVQAKLWAVNLATGARRGLADSAHKAWHVNGGIVVFANQRTGQAFAAPLNEKSLAFRAPPTLVLEGVRRLGGESIMMNVSENGTLFFSPDAGPPLEQMVWISREGAVTPVDSAWSFVGGGTALSPDGRRLAVSVRSGTTFDIWVKELAPGGAHSRLSFAGAASNPAWSADGGSVLYQQAVKGGVEFELVRRRLNGADSAEVLLRSSRDFHSFSVLRDTTKLLVRLGAPATRDIFLARRGGSRPGGTLVPLLANDGYEEITPSLSPDERWLAYGSNESGRWEVYVVPFPDVTTGRWQVSATGGRSPRWARSGRELFFRDLAGGLVAVPVTNGPSPVFGERRVLFQMKGIPLAGFSMGPMEFQFDVSPDDRRFLFARAFGQEDPAAATRTILVQNWLTEIKNRMKGAR
jgi:hypothetical protein